MSEKIVAVDRALDVLNYLFDKEEEAGTSEMSRKLDIPKSAIHRTLKTLEDKNFVYKNKVTDKYWLGMKLYAIGQLIRDKISLIDIIEPYAEKLHDEVGEVINVSILEVNRNKSFKSIVIYKKTDTTNVLSVNPKVGSSVDAHTSSVGKTLLAFNKEINYEEAKENIELKAYTKNTVTDWDELLKELEDIRKKGYALDNEEREEGLYCLGTPILDKSNNAIAAMSISGPAFRMKDKNLEEMVKLLKNATKEINKEIKDIIIRDFRL